MEDLANETRLKTNTKTKPAALGVDVTVLCARVSVREWVGLAVEKGSESQKLQNNVRMSGRMDG